jgi:LacI family transcriptional regulator
MSITRIAEAAKVSYATAWRIINNQPCSSEQAVAAVRAAMGQLGYDPNAAKRRGRGRRPKMADGIRTHNIALLHLRHGTSISTAILDRVQRMLGERNLNLIFGHVEKPTDQLPQALRSGNVDGILGYGQFPHAALEACPRLRQVPAVWMMSRSDHEPDEWGDRIKPDHYRIGQLAAKHLLSHGHKKLAYLNPDISSQVYQQRYAAFAAEIQMSAPDVSVRVYSSPGARADGREDVDVEAARLAEEFLAIPERDRPTGVFIPVDRITLRMYRLLEKAGVEIDGEHLDVVSCDNARDLLSLMHPRPASIDINTQTIARLAVERLFWRMKNGLSSPSVVVTVSPTLGGGSASDEKAEEVPVAAAETRSLRGNGAVAASGRTIHRSIDRAVVRADGDGVAADGNGAGDGDGHDGSGAVHAL